MENTQLTAAIAALVPDAEVKHGRQFVEVTVKSEKILAVMETLKETKDTSFDLLVSLTGMDWGTDLGVVYHLRSTVFNHMIVVKIMIPDRENPSADSLCQVYPGAEFHEREVYDLLGIRFNGHPDLRRLFLDSSWGYPLRKDYKDDVNIVSK